MLLRPCRLCSALGSVLDLTSSPSSPGQRSLHLSGRRRQELQLTTLAAKLAQLADGASRRQTDQLRQELRQLRQEFVQSQLERAGEQEGEGGTGAV